MHTIRIHLVDVRHRLAQYRLQRTAWSARRRRVQHLDDGSWRLVVQLAQRKLPLVVRLRDVERFLALLNELLRILGCSLVSACHLLRLLLRGRRHGLHLDEEVVLRKVPLRGDRRHASASRGGDGLAPLGVVQVTGAEHAGHGRAAPVRDAHVPSLVEVHLAVEHRAVGCVPDAVEHSRDGNCARVAVAVRWHDAHRVHRARLRVAKHVIARDVCQNLNVGVRFHALLHRHRRAHRAAHEQVHLAGILGEVQRLLECRVPSADNRDRLALEDWTCTVTDGTRADSSAPEGVL
mmetsp:Transcript_9820/g.24859  ORF Transcript_9820/g.24859 Transcript_9820/m.24859 type:complete len:292 (+) Transcript_9820:378-1253(+)